MDPPDQSTHKASKFVKSLDGRKRDKTAQRLGQSKHSQNSYEAAFQSKRGNQNDSNSGDFLLDLAATQAQLQAQEEVLTTPYTTLPSSFLPDLSENELMNELLGLQSKTQFYVNPTYDYSRNATTTQSIDTDDLANSPSVCSPYDNYVSSDTRSEMALSPPPPPLTPHRSEQQASSPIIRKLLCHQPERFTSHFVELVKSLWPPLSPFAEALSGLPKNGEDKPYREEQLEQLAARVHKDLRRMKQAQPGHANYEFLNILQMCLEVKCKTAEKDKDKDVQVLKTKLRKSVCIKSISSKTQDSRIQIEKWEAPTAKFPNGKAKKVYLHWELYNLFNVIDEGRYDRTKQKIKHTQLFRAYCSKEKTLMCLNPCHYEAVMDHAKFSERIIKLVENYRGPHGMESILDSKEKYTSLTIWTRDIHKYIEWSVTCAPSRFLNIVESRLDNKSSSVGSLSKKLQNFGFGRQACIYYTERTPRDKMKELESRLVEFCRPEVHRKLQQHGDKNDRVIRWSCDDKNEQRYCCNPDHVDSYCPNTVAHTGRHALSAMFNRTFKQTSRQTEQRQPSDEPNKWCYIYFNRFSIPSQRNLLIENRKVDNNQVLYTQDKNVHDTFEGYFKDTNQHQSETLCEIKIEPFKVTDHHQKNYYKNQLKNPSEFNLQYKPFDDRKRCKHFGHIDCRYRICEQSFVRNVNFSFTLELKRCKSHNAAVEPDYTISVLNTGSSDLWIHSVQIALNTHKKDTSKVKAEQIDNGIHFMRVAPLSKMAIMTLDKHFRQWIEQFNSKQIRAIKEKLHTAYIVLDGALIESNGNNNATLNGSLSDVEHFNVVSLLHFICLSEFEKNLTKSEIIDSK